MPVTNDKDVPPASLGVSFGEELRKEREIRGISLAEIAEATKISKRFLGAIEKNDFATLPAPVFARGFVREYARYLGLNAEDMVTRYAHFMNTQGKAAEDDPVPLRSSDQVPAGESASQRRTKRLVIIAAVLLVPLLIAGGWMASDRWKRQRTVIPPVDVPVMPASPLPAETAPQEPAAADTPLSLTLAASEDVWIVLSADGAQVLSGKVGAGQERTFTAREQFELESVGNAGSLALTLNGVALPSLGEKGEVIRNRVFTRAGAAALMRTRTPSP